MPESTGKHAYGSTVRWGTDGITFANQLEVVMCNVPGRKRNSAKATHLESPDNYKENRPGMKEVPPFKATLNFRDDQYQALETPFEAGTKLYFKFSEPLETGQTNPDNTVIAVFISELGEKKLDPEDTSVEVFDLELTHWSTKPTFTPGS